jgi:hypothetical protein
MDPLFQSKEIRMAKRAKYAVDTKVPVTQTRTEIETTLTKFGATSFAYGLQPNKATIAFQCSGRHVRFDIKLPKDTSEAKTARLHREKWRALFLAVKAKLVSVDTEIETFEEAFMSHIVLADGRTVGDSVKPAIEQEYKTGKPMPLLLSGPTP